MDGAKSTERPETPSHAETSLSQQERFNSKRTLGSPYGNVTH